MTCLLTVRYDLSSSGSLYRESISPRGICANITLSRGEHVSAEADAGILKNPVLHLIADHVPSYFTSR